MTYIENPKTKGSGILCAIPQTGRCPNRCEDCFFQSGRSYLEPLEDNLPNMPSVEDGKNHIIRINDGNDSNNKREEVIAACRQYPFKFYNTAIPNHLNDFDAPVVLTINPAKMTDNRIYKVSSIPNNLMFVRMRTNTWNLDLVQEAVDYYCNAGIPVMLTFMAYEHEDSIPKEHRKNYVYRKRTLNPYFAIKTDAWKEIMDKYREKLFVYSCGKVEGERGKTSCRHCGNCVREYFACMELMKKRDA